MDSLKQKYPNDLKLLLTSDTLIYYVEKVDFLDDNLLYDLYTYIEDNKLNVTIFFDSEREYIKEE